MDVTVSIIVPTHNRSKSVKELLNVLASQSYPLALIEVVVVADGCSDDTVAMLQQYKPGFSLRFIQLPGLGAATARNAGAAEAKGNILVFLDDDIEPSVDLVRCHVQAHRQHNTVVIGYLPITLPKKASLHQISMAGWWEQKFISMKNTGYRYGYDDLISGNFSIRSQLFTETNKFDTSFRCREDYELGARLIKSGADIVFAEKAWGYHRDETFIAATIYGRKRQEGKADVQFAEKHPDLLPRLPLNYYGAARSNVIKALIFLVFKIPSVADQIAHLLLRILERLEKLKQRKLWTRLDIQLQRYWYSRGIADKLKTQQALHSFMNRVSSTTKKENVGLTIDLKNGVPSAMMQLDSIRPDYIYINFGIHFIGETLPRPGFEKFKGAHLQPMLLNQFSQNFTYALMIENLVNKMLPVNL